MLSSPKLPLQAPWTNVALAWPSSTARTLLPHIFPRPNMDVLYTYLLFVVTTSSTSLAYRSSWLPVLCTYKALFEYYHMSLPQEYPISKLPITSHAFNADRTRSLTCLQLIYHTFWHADFLELAVSLNSNEAQVLARKGNEWKAMETLVEVCGHYLRLSAG